MSIAYCKPSCNGETGYKKQSIEYDSCWFAERYHQVILACRRIAFCIRDLIDEKNVCRKQANWNTKVERQDESQS